MPLDGARVAALAAERHRSSAGQVSALTFCAVGSTTSTTAYGKAALERECGRLATSLEGARNTTLNATAFAVGQLCAGGELAAAEAMAGLQQAAKATGLRDDEIARTISNGFTAGLENPRSAPGPYAVSVEELAADNTPRLAPQNITPRCAWIPTVEIFAPLPPMPWLVRELQLGPGRPNMIAGYSFSAKTLAAQALGLAIAVGGRAWECPLFGCATARVRHFDHEQGARASRRRYQRLTFGHGLRVEDLADRLELASYPRLHLTDDDAEDAYARECEGVAFAILDPLRALIPGVDENDSRVGNAIEKLGRISDKTGTTFLLLHHSGKPKEGQVDRRSTPRGSSAIFGACGLVLDFVAGRRGDPVRVEQTKSPADAEGPTIESFFLELADVPDGSNPKAGVRVTYRTIEQVKPATAPVDDIDADCARALVCIRQNPGVRGKAHLAELLRIRPARAAVVVDGLLERGVLVDRRTQANRPKLYVTAVGSNARED